MATLYKTFKRSATNWKSFSAARKYGDRCDLTYAEAQQRCNWWNENRTAAQIRRGTKMEFTAQ